MTTQAHEGFLAELRRRGATSVRRVVFRHNRTRLLSISRDRVTLNAHLCFVGAPPDVLERIEANRQVVFRYTTPDGRLDDAANPNGSVHAIAGICNDKRNVVGMMPHPERAAEAALGCTDGLVILESIVKAFATA